MILCLIVALLSIQAIFTENSYAVVNKNLLTAIKYHSQGKYPEAVTKYTEIIENSPLNLDSYYNLATIFEIVLADYESAVHLYDKAISIAENKIAFFMPGQEGKNKEELNRFVAKINKHKNDSIEKMFTEINNISFPRYIVLKDGKSLSEKPLVKGAKLKEALTGSRNEFQFVDIQNNWYRVILSSDKYAWINGNDVRLIYQDSNKSITLNHEQKTKRYKWFVNSFPTHTLAENARKMIEK